LAAAPIVAGARRGLAAREAKKIYRFDRRRSPAGDDGAEPM